MALRVGHWIGNVVKCAGRDINQATQAVTTESGKVGKALNKIPVVGGVLHALYDVAFEGTLGMLVMTEQVTVGGQRVDRVVLAHLKSQLDDFKEIGPYAQMVLSFIPGIGQGISAAIGAGLALANGQPISKAIMAGIKGAIPGGPLAQMAFEAATDTAQAVIEHRKVSFSSVVSEGVDVITAGLDLPIPDIAKRALEGGLQCAGQLCQGKRLDKALVSSFAAELPLPDDAKKAIGDVMNLADSLATGQRVDQAFTQALGQATALLPIPPDVKASLLNVKQLVAHGDVYSPWGEDLDPKAKSLQIKIDHAVTDIFLDHAKGHMTQAQKDSVNVGIAMIQGTHVQTVTAPQLAPGGPVVGKLMAQGQTLVQTDEVLKGAYQALPDGKIGFQIGAALGRKQCDTHQVISIRKGLAPADKRGFDLALSIHVGRVAHPAPKRILGHKAKAGYYATLGMQGAPPNLKMSMMSVVASDPVMRAGAKVGVDRVVDRRDSWWNKVRRYLNVA
jgi:hypothetical protein